jgi:hypothetical protein
VGDAGCVGGWWRLVGGVDGEVGVGSVRAGAWLLVVACGGDW